MAADPDHYRVLGVRPAASAQEIRSAHRRLVHAVHPDRHVQASPAERRLAERRMREINVAWHTLSDPGRRRTYDAGRVTAAPSPRPPQPPRTGAGAGAYARPAGSRPPSARPSGAAPPFTTSHSEERPTAPDPDDLEVHPGTFFLLRRGPVVALIVVGLLLFVVTAYVGGDGGEGDTTEVPGDPCVLLLQGSEAVLVDCSVPNDGEVVAEVDAPLDCPESTKYARVGSTFYCIPLGAGET